MDEKTEQNLYMVTVGVGILNICMGLFNVLLSVLYMFLCIGFVTIIPALLQCAAGVMQLMGQRTHVVTGLSALGMVAALFTFNIMGLVGCGMVTAATFGVWYWEQQELAKL